MLVSGVPWQAALAAGLIGIVAFAACLFLSLIVAFLGWSIPVVMLHVVALFLLVLLVPTYLNLSRTFYGWLLGLLAMYAASAILGYALLYRHAGIMSGAGVSHSLRDAIYFSVTTWTTLGYGDFTPPPEMRLVTSAEALLGATNLAFAASFLWLYCSELLLPRDMAVLDGAKFHLQSGTWHRMRIRNVRGLPRTLEGYIDPPDPGTVVYWDKRKERWDVLPKDAVVPEDTHIMTFE